MAFDASTIWEINSSGSDSSNGGGFAPGNPNFATDLAATLATGSSPVVTSVSYNFIARDVGAWLFVKAGTSWTPGWYQIASVASNAATLTASVGSVNLYNGVTMKNTTAGCATVASPTGGTWSIDYSQSAATGIAYTDLAIDAALNTKFSSVLKPTGPNLVGNVISVTGGTGFTVQRVQVVSNAGTISATCDKSLGTLSSTGGVGGLGGALASPGLGAGLMVSSGSNQLAIKNSGAAGSPTAYTFSNSANVSGGKVQVPGGSSTAMSQVFGYASTRNIANTDEAPTIQPSANSVVLVYYNGGNVDVRNLSAINPGSFTTCTGFQLDNGSGNCERCNATSLATGFNSSFGANRIAYCLATTCGQSFFVGSQTRALWCTSIGDTTGGFSCGGNTDTLENCICTGGAGTGFLVSNQSVLKGCIAQGMTGASGNGFDLQGSILCDLENCIAINNAQLGYKGTANVPTQRIWNCAGYNNTGGNYSTAQLDARNLVGFVALTADPFTSTSTKDFTPNSTVGGGVLLKGLGWPATLPGLAPTNYPSVGAYQPNTAAAGGAGVVVGCNFIRGLGAVA